LSASSLAWGLLCFGEVLAASGLIYGVFRLRGRVVAERRHYGWDPEPGRERSKRERRRRDWRIQPRATLREW
jgi:hypothetical protein